MKEVLGIDAALIKLLKQLRLEEGLSQSGLADKLEMAQSFVSKYESGERTLSFSETWQISKHLNISPEKLINKIKIELGEEVEGKS